MALTDILRTFQDESTIVKKASNVYVEKSTDGVSLKGVLQRGRLRLTRERKPYPQGVSFRPSTITYSYCRRAKVGQLAGLVDLYDDKPAPKQQLVFDFGHAIHDIIQGYFWDIGILKGSYHCLKCDKTYDNLLSPKLCPSAIKSHTRRHLVYKEIIARNDEYKIKGRSDGVLWIDEQDHVMDIKSIANRALSTPERQFCFEDLAAHGPKEDHIIQLNLYMWMLGIPRGHLLYVAKNDHKIQTFFIPYDESTIRPYLNEISYLIELSRALSLHSPVDLPDPCGNDKCHCHEILSIKAA